MKALIIEKNANGIVNTGEIDSFELSDIKDFRDVEDKIHKLGKYIKDYKYHIFKDDEFIPGIFRVIDGFYNQMQEFNFERITFRELPVTDEKRKEIIEKIEGEKKSSAKQKLLLEKLELLYYVQVDETKQAEILEVTTKLEELNEKIDYTEYLNELV